ncbi:unnamed protein product [Phyllotreta striolata]|uniref:Cathepsin propeptide inhibitor domain-containing protein n=1 Tax=Phyllotreta striolata TaxID=444603 RepID=A0A9N9TIM9_PHYSR|nr:unnamed protein product [Phyllotreta striolata]
MNAKLLLLFLFVAVAFANAESNDLRIEDIEDREEAWRQFKIKYNKKYDTPEEENKRKAIFLDTHKDVTEHNKKYKNNEVSYSQGIYEFADLTAEEFRRTHTGLRGHNGGVRGAIPQA